MKKILKMLLFVLEAYFGKALEATMYYVALVLIPGELIGALWRHFVHGEALEQGEIMMLGLPLYVVFVGVVGLAIMLVVAACGSISDRFSKSGAVPATTDAHGTEGGGEPEEDALTLAVLEVIVFLMSAAGLVWLLCRAFSRIA